MLDEGGAGGQMGVGGRLAEREHGRHARVRPLEDGRPLLARTGAEPLGDGGAQLVPPGQVLTGRGDRVEPQEAAELVVELLLQRTDGHVLTVGGLVGAVERAASVEQVGAAPVLPATGRHHAVDHGGEVGGAVHDRGVHDLPLPRRPGVLESGEDADDEIERAARVVAHEVGGDGRALVRPADHAEGAGDGDVRDVVSGAGGERAVLAPAGHPSVDQLRVAGQALPGPDAETLGDARAVALDEDVGPFDQVEDAAGAVLGLQVDQYGALVAVGQVVRGVDGQARAAGAVDPDHIGAEVGQEHRGERAGPDPRQLDHAHPGERAVP